LITILNILPLLIAMLVTSRQLQAQVPDPAEAPDGVEFIQPGEPAELRGLTRVWIKVTPPPAASLDRAVNPRRAATETRMQIAIELLNLEPSLELVKDPGEAEVWLLFEDRGREILGIVLRYLGGDQHRLVIPIWTAHRSRLISRPGCNFADWFVREWRKAQAPEVTKEAAKSRAP
jgi:hypothetical protein